MKFQRQECVIQTDRQRSLWLRAEEETHLLPSSPLSSCLSSPISSSLHFFSFLSSLSYYLPSCSPLPLSPRLLSCLVSCFITRQNFSSSITSILFLKVRKAGGVRQYADGRGRFPRLMDRYFLSMSFPYNQYIDFQNKLQFLYVH